MSEEWKTQAEYSVALALGDRLSDALSVVKEWPYTDSSDLLQTPVKISEFIFSSSIADFSNMVATSSTCGCLNVN